MVRPHLTDPILVHATEKGGNMPLSIFVLEVIFANSARFQTLRGSHFDYIALGNPITCSLALALNQAATHHAAL